jgi:hypothetical protein
VMKLISQMVATQDQLTWLVGVMINQVGEWHGPAELRGVFCNRFKPADGIEADCVMSRGFTIGEAEMKALDRHEQIKREEIAAGPSALRGLLGGGE